MPRKRITIDNKSFDKPFPSALRELMKENNTTQQELAAELGKTRQSISYYCDGSSSPDWETIANIAKYYSVSADWLLGLSDVRSPHADLKAVCDFTGLSEASVESILRETTNEETRHILNTILCFNPYCFHKMIQNVQKGVSIEKKHKNNPFNWESIPEEIRQEIFEYFDVDKEDFGSLAGRTSEQYFEKAAGFLKFILHNYLLNEYSDDTVYEFEFHGEITPYWKDGVYNGND